MATSRAQALLQRSSLVMRMLSAKSSHPSVTPVMRLQTITFPFANSCKFQRHFSSSGQNPAAGDRADGKAGGHSDSVGTERPTSDESSASTLTRLREEVEKAQREKEKLLELAAEREDKYLRALAEIQNVRQRLQRQIDDAKQFGIQAFCKDLLEVADILSVAVESSSKTMDTLRDDGDAMKDTALKNILDGLRMTETQLLKVFEKHGLVPLRPADGEKFDPAVHEALFEVPREGGKAPRTIAAVAKIGYLLHQRVIRPARVGVVRKE